LHLYPRATIGDDHVPGDVEDAATMGCDQPVDDDPIGFKLGKCACFVARPQPALAGAVGREDPSQLAFDCRSRHRLFSAGKYIEAKHPAWQFYRG
jgi:hypothetical protein